MNRIEKPTHDIHQAVMDIKTAIMQGQYEAAKGVNRIQLAVYYGIGKYVSQHTRKGVWGSGALDAISEQLRRELPGLRGYSATALRNMRKFYEAWIMLDANSSITTDELKTAIAIAENESNKRNGSLDGKSAIAIAEVEAEQRIDVYNAIRIPDMTILDEKIRKPHENPSIGIVLCKSANREYVEFMIRDYTKPMGVATYKTSDEMPEHLRKALPTNEEFARLLEKKHNMED